jgi:tripartite-type tricarboxylate transporter receptor subunit TctC
MKKPHVVMRLGAVLALGLSAGSVLAQGFPNRAIRIISPYAAGGPSELVARVVASGLATEFGQPVIVEAKPGAGTVIGADYVAKAPADGYTLLLTTIAPVIIQPLINPRIPYDAHRDFVPVGLFASVPNLVSVPPSLPVKNLQELVERARREPGRVSYASAGTGTSPHLAGELFRQMAGIDITHVPYRGAAPAVVDVVSGEVAVSFLNITPQLQYVRTGRLRALAITTANRSPLLPDVPTVAESGYPGYLAESWNGLMAPSATPRPVIDTLARAMLKVMALPVSREKLLAMGAEERTLGPEAFAAYLAADEARLTPIVRALGMKPE